LSETKGGRLAEMTRAEVIGLVLSDVVGDDLATIGSGPIVPDPTTFADALKIAQAAEGVPPAVVAALEAGVANRHPETPKSPRPGVRAEVIAGPADLVRVAANHAARRGYAVTSMSGLTGEVEA